MKHSEETKAKIKAAWVKRKETFIPPMKGKTMSDESRQKMSDSAKKRGSNRTGVKHTVETRLLISKLSRERSPKGKDAPSYKDGKLSERRDQRFSRDYKRWRFDVFARDEFTCQLCGDNRGGNLVAHHIKPFSEFQELRFDIENGLTVCENCHKEIHDK